MLLPLGDDIVLVGMPRPGIIGLVTPSPPGRPVTAPRWRFEGEIAAFGTATGHRIVAGRWPVSPFGPISDVMVEAPDGIGRGFS
ncbi:MAG: hypothetical protein ACRDRX_09445 [Pseudonocardiaceae bacterium]